MFYDSLQQHKLLQQSVDKLTGQMQAQRVRQGQSRYLFGVGATLLVSGTILLLGGVEVFPAWMMAAGVVAWGRRLETHRLNKLTIRLSVVAAALQKRGHIQHKDEGYIMRQLERQRV
ncbi:Probable ubiquinone biosynthesis protein UbiB [Serratia fonticola]|uniref:Probable ubiquinone biosynthesis protein UbiB n=1 Tax=Serratia fonticola TaxID=47917 RepID=A0A4U9WM25_SERFO|nr:Probable ubiquinone biosynthesis protein UbiB [Serratia fonticola]